MKILVACEESQAVTIELRRLGHEAYSCDIEPCSGGHPEWHLQVDALELLKMKWDVPKQCAILKIEKVHRETGALSFCGSPLPACAGFNHMS